MFKKEYKEITFDISIEPLSFTKNLFEKNFGEKFLIEKIELFYCLGTIRKNEKYVEPKKDIKAFIVINIYHHSI